jgi:hypothetical protein
MMWLLLLCESQRTLRLFTLRIERCVIFSLDPSTSNGASTNGEWEKAAGSARMMAYVLNIFGGLNRNIYGDEV